MTTAAYYREWRAAHPAYRDRQRLLKNARRRLQPRGSRAAEYARRSRAVTLAPMTTLHHGHALFDAARAVVGPARSGLTILYDPLHEDLLSEAVVALIEGRDPSAAVRAYRAAETTWRRITGPLLREFAA